MNIKVPDELVKEVGGQEAFFNLLASNLKFSPEKFTTEIVEKFSALENKLTALEKNLETFVAENKLRDTTQDERFKALQKDFEDSLTKIKAESARTVMEAIAGSGLKSPVNGGNAEVNSGTEKQPKFADIFEQQFSSGKFPSVQEAMKYCIQHFPNEYEEYRKNPEPLKFTK